MKICNILSIARCAWQTEEGLCTFSESCEECTSSKNCEKKERRKR